MATVCVFALIAFNVAIRHWYRYENNATVLSLETDYRAWHYPLFGITVCSNYTDDAAIAAIVEMNWNVTKGHTLYMYYEDFVRTIATTTHHSLHNYGRFAADVTLQNVNMLDMVTMVRRKYLNGLDRTVFTPIITEFGVCYTNGYFRNNLRLNPHFADDVLKTYHSAPRFTYLDVMQMSIAPYVFDKKANITIVSCTRRNLLPMITKSVSFQFIHSKMDVISEHTSCKLILHDDSMVEVTIEQKSIAGSRALHAISIHRRQCRYVNESNLGYYPYYYTKTLCEITCRIQMAIKLCKCVPFFYSASELIFWHRFGQPNEITKNYIFHLKKIQKIQIKHRVRQPDSIVYRKRTGIKQIANAYRSANTKNTPNLRPLTTCVWISVSDYLILTKIFPNFPSQTPFGQNLLM